MTESDGTESHTGREDGEPRFLRILRPDSRQRSGWPHSSDATQTDQSRSVPGRKERSASPARSRATTSSFEANDLEESGLGLLDFGALLEAAPDGVAVVNELGEIVVINDQFSALFGYTAAELSGARVESLVPERLRAGHVRHRDGYASKPARRPMGLGANLVGLRKDGTEFAVEISLSPVSSSGRTFTIATVRDVTERRLLEAEREMVRTILDTEQERHRIGMDLHDGIMQDVYAVTLGLEMAYEDIDVEPGQAKESVGRAIDQLQDVIRDIRSYIFDLRPRQYNGDLHQALLDLAREFQENSSIATEVQAPPDLPAVDQQVGVAFYIIAHEALSNTRKYAEATRALISLSQSDGALHLHLQDNGRGFDASAEIPEGHRGVRNMTSRAAMIGAHMRIDSSPGAGTTIHILLPMT